MSDELHDLVKGYSNEELLEQYVYSKNEYTAEAIAVLEAELAARGITSELIDDYVKKSRIDADGGASNVSVKHFNRSEFTKLEGAFPRSEAALLRAMLADEKIPYFFDALVDIDPALDPDDRQLVHVSVHKDDVEKARTLIALHFTLASDVYTLQHNDARERLVAFGFQELANAAADSVQVVDVDLSEAERNVLQQFGKRLLDEIDSIETSSGRIVFFFDNVPELLEKCGNPHATLSKTDLLTALEILQIYCYDAAFPQTGIDMALSLLGFFGA